MTKENKLTPDGSGNPKTKSKKKRRLPVSRGWQWTAIREHAAQLVADAELSSAEIVEQIARELGHYGRLSVAEMSLAAGIAVPVQHQQQPSPIDLDALSVDELAELERLAAKMVFSPIGP